MRLHNLNQLIINMNDLRWFITAFTFSYKHQSYTVLVEDTHCFVPHQNDVIARLSFHKQEDETQTLVVESSNNYLYIDISTLRRFFNVEYQENFGDWLSEFYSRLNTHIPSEYPHNNTIDENKLINSTLNNGDSNSGECIYSVKHNANNGQRTPFNDNKARRLCPDVYEEYCADNNISFCFRESNALSLSEIRTNFAKNLNRT